MKEFKSIEEYRDKKEKRTYKHNETIQKICSILIVLVLIFCCVSCSTKYQSEISRTPQVSKSDALVSEAKDSPKSETKESPKENKAPDHIRDFFTLLKKYTNNNECDFKIVSKAPIFEEIISDYYQYIIEIEATEGEFITSRKIEFDADDSGKARRSFSLFFDSKEDGKLIKSFITAALNITNTSLSVEDCKTNMQNLVNSYSTDKVSIYLDNGNFVFLIVPSSFGDFGLNSTLYVRYKDEASLVPETTEGYDDLANINAMSELNKGENVYFTATIIEERFDDIHFDGYRSSYLVCNTGSGDTVYITFRPQDVIVEFEEGSSYAFYGHIAAPSNNCAIIVMHGAIKNE